MWLRSKMKVPKIIILTQTITILIINVWTKEIEEAENANSISISNQSMKIIDPNYFRNTHAKCAANRLNCWEEKHQILVHSVYLLRELCQGLVYLIIITASSKARLMWWTKVIPGEKKNADEQSIITPCWQELHCSRHLIFKAYLGKLWIRLVCHMAVASEVHDLTGSR